ncbi:MAG: archaeosortase/exosortase family protein [Bacteroidales bacterium]|nr:archaeosortase/exosortase family protein [Bacteroidales bacterium]
MKTKEILLRVWANANNRKLIKNFAALSVASVVFHFLYWNANMDSWLFGPWTKQVFDFFTLIAFEGSRFLLESFCDLNFYCENMCFYFFRSNPQSGVEIYAVMNIIHDCSAVKQLLQFFLILLLCTGCWWKKIPYFFGGCVVLILVNIVRIYLLTTLFAHNPENFQFYHDWVARPIMYVVIFLLWIVWVLFFGSSKPKSDSTQDKR